MQTLELYSQWETIEVLSKVDDRVSQIVSTYLRASST